jgi:hypothetical protein
MAPATNSTTAPPLSLREVLQVYLTCFNVAADAFPQPPAAYALLRYDDSLQVKFWMVWSTEDLEIGPPKDIERFSFLPPGLNEALARHNMCDWFYMVLEREVNQKVGDLFQGRAEWLVCCPKTTVLLRRRYAEDKLLLPLHSVLQITTAGGEKVVMDGTLEQFSWASSTWLQTWTEWCAQRVDEEEGSDGWWFAPANHKISTAQASARVAGGFWATVYWRLEGLFGELDWVKLRNMETNLRIEYVKTLAREKFADLLEEALNF